MDNKIFLDSPFGIEKVVTAAKLKFSACWKSLLHAVLLGIWGCYILKCLSVMQTNKNGEFAGDVQIKLPQTAEVPSLVWP